MVCLVCSTAFAGQQVAFHFVLCLLRVPGLLRRRKKLIGFPFRELVVIDCCPNQSVWPLWNDFDRHGTFRVCTTEITGRGCRSVAGDDQQVLIRGSYRVSVYHKWQLFCPIAISYQCIMCLPDIVYKIFLLRQFLRDLSESTSCTPLWCM